MFISDSTILSRAIENFDNLCDLGIKGQTHPLTNYRCDDGLVTNEFGVIHFPPIKALDDKFYIGKVFVSYKDRENGKRYHAVYGVEIDGTVNFWSC
jgi:hypothetical protein